MGHLAAGDAKLAARLLGRLARRDDCDPRVYEQLGLLKIQQGAVKDGLSLLKRAVRAGAPTPEQYHNIGYALLLSEDAGQAIAYLRRAIELGLHFHPAYNTLGLALQSADKFAEAAACFAQAIALDSANWRYHSNDALLRHLVGDDDGAVRGYEQALALGAQSNADVLNNFAGVLLHLGRADEALARCDQALRCGGERADIRFNRAGAHKALKRFDAALADYDAALRLKPEHRGAAFGRAETFNTLGRFAEAVDGFERYLAIIYVNAPQAKSLIALGRKLFALECMPAIYRSEQELAYWRGEAERLVEEIDAATNDIGVTRASARSLPLAMLLGTSLFYLGYQQRDDRRILERFSASAQKLLQAGAPA
jgi:tetratricopeptide (TPR) repeat protein